MGIGKLEQRMSIVFNGAEEETARRGGGSGLGAIMGGENRGYVLEVHVTARDIEHGADEIAHHVVKESIAADAIDEQVEAVGGLLVPRGGVDGADGGMGFNRIDKDLSLGIRG